jgi:phage terminase small subunit
MANGKLTAKQQCFIDEYLQSGNATDAARKAGYQGDDNTLGVTGYDNLRNPKIAKVLQARINQSGLTADETLRGIADIARGDLSAFFNVAGGIPILDFEKAEKEGKLPLLKKLTVAEGKITFELYDKQRALETFAKYHGLLKDKMVHEGEITLKQKLYKTVSPDDWDDEKDKK